jgi:telomerase Cajal body protein 1
MFAAGSLAASNANIALIDAESEKIIGYPCPTADVNVGVSQLAFNPSKPYHLYASYRRSNKILEWDLRGDINAPTRTFQRQSAGTNQRMRFDINIGGQYLATGDEVRCQILTSAVRNLTNNPEWTSSSI